MRTHDVGTAMLYVTYLTDYTTGRELETQEVEMRRTTYDNAMAHANKLMADGEVMTVDVDWLPIHSPRVTTRKNT